jgi:beta-phosphoglucomutase
VIKAFIFDLDGVIVDTARYHFLAWERLAKELGFSFTESQNEALKGVSRMQALDILLDIGGVDASPAEKERLASRKNEWYVEYLGTLTHDSMLPGAADFIEATHRLGIKTALGSASKNARTILEKLDIVNDFEAIVDGTMTSRAKPDPQVFELGAQQLGVPYESCVVFEDAQAGIEAANAANMIAVGIGSPDNLKGAVLVMPSLDLMTPELLIEKLENQLK